MRSAPSSAPAGLVGAALVLWGVSIRLPWLGVAAALAFESMRAFQAGAAGAARWARPLARLSALLAVAFLGYAIATRALPDSLYMWLRWMPMVMLPLAALAAAAGPLRLAGRELELGHGYAALTLAAAGTGTGAQDWLYAAFALLVGWALFARTPRPRRAVAAAMLGIAAAIGFGVQVAISQLQGKVEEWGTEFLADLLSGKPDPLRERTRIGDLGKIKLSDRIVMRVAVDGTRPRELLLRESAFDRYRNGEWHATRRAARPAAHENGRWVVSDGEATTRLSMRRSLPGGEGLLALPYGTRTVAGLPAQKLDLYPSGAVLASGAPRFVAMRVDYDPAAGIEPPTPADLEVPELLRDTIARIVHEERVAQPAEAAVRAVREFFAGKFAYSLDLGDARRGARTLADFLLRDRKGHCEYFASATVLLLRQAGVPARYVGGYSAQEYSAREGAYLVRARHAHAWAAAYVDGRWIAVDTTPSRWADLEGEAARGFLGPVLDRLSWLVDQAIQAWMATPLTQLATAGGAILGLMLAAAAAFVVARRRRVRPPRDARSRDPVITAWEALEGRMARRGHGRAPGETVRQWISRLEAGAAARLELAVLAPLATAYYRVRFDPAATTESRLRFLASARELDETLAGRRGGRS